MPPKNVKSGGQKGRTRVTKRTVMEPPSDDEQDRQPREVLSARVRPEVATEIKNLAKSKATTPSKMASKIMHVGHAIFQICEETAIDEEIRYVMDDEECGRIDAIGNVLKVGAKFLKRRRDAKSAKQSDSE